MVQYLPNSTGIAGGPFAYSAQSGPICSLSPTSVDYVMEASTPPNNNLVVNEISGDDPGALTAPYVNCMTSFGSHAGDTQGYSDGHTWKTGGMISVNGTLYMVVARQTGAGTNAYPQGLQVSEDASIIKSTDHGRTWSNAFGKVNDPNGAAPPYNATTGHVLAMFPGTRFSAPFFINYGQDDNPASTTDGGDTYLYALSNNGFAYNGSTMILGRVRRDRIGNLNAADWQFYTGTPGAMAMIRRTGPAM